MRRLTYAFWLCIAAGLVITAALLPRPVSAATDYAQRTPEHEPINDCTTWGEGLAGRPSGTMAEVVPTENLPNFIAALQEVAGMDLPLPDRAFVVFIPPLAVVGLEIDGCLLDPLVIMLGSPA